MGRRVMDLPWMALYCCVTAVPAVAVDAVSAEVEVIEQPSESEV